MLSIRYRKLFILKSVDLFFVVTDYAISLLLEIKFNVYNTNKLQCIKATYNALIQ